MLTLWLHYYINIMEVEVEVRTQDVLSVPGCALYFFAQQTGSVFEI